MKLIFSIIFLVILTSVSNAYAEIFQTATCGGNGGHKFRREVPEGSMLTSITVRSGAFVDYLKFTVRDPAGNPLVIEVGGGGGTLHEPIEVSNKVNLNELNMRCGAFVDSIQFQFSDSSSTDTYGGGGGNPVTIRLPPNAEFRGIYGSAGSYIDRIGLLYSVD